MIMRTVSSLAENSAEQVRSLVTSFRCRQASADKYVSSKAPTLLPFGRTDECLCKAITRAPLHSKLANGARPIKRIRVAFLGANGDGARGPQRFQQGGNYLWQFWDNCVSTSAGKPMANASGTFNVLIPG